MAKSDHAAVTTLLQDSMVAHRRALVLRQQRKPGDAKAALREAFDLRLKAHTLDPAHQAPAWTAKIIDRKHPHVGMHKHDQLMAFYRQQCSLDRLDG